MSPAQVHATKKASAASANDDFDTHPLTLSSLRVRLREYINSEKKPLPTFAGKGIVITAGGRNLLANAYVCIRSLREHGCTLPIEVWYLNGQEWEPGFAEPFKGMRVRFVNAANIRRKHPARLMGGWELKPYSVLYSQFEEVLFLDADNVTLRNPEFLFTTRAYLAWGAIFWPDICRDLRADPVWKACDAARPQGEEIESGQFIVDKKRCFQALQLACWINGHSDFFYKFFHGDKETFRLAFEILQQPYSFAWPITVKADGIFHQHGPDGLPLFQHRSECKWIVKKNKPFRKAVLDVWKLATEIFGNTDEKQ